MQRTCLQPELTQNRKVRGTTWEHRTVAGTVILK
jgi:hypothetical protein